MSVAPTKLRAAVGLPLAYAALATVFTWPLAARPGEIGVLAGSAPFDALIFLWNFDWLASSLASGTSPLSTDVLFFPERVSLMLHTHTLLYALVSLPVQAVVPGEPGLQLALQLVVVASFTAAGLATYALARRQGLSPGAAFLAGVAFAFCASRMTNLPRLHVLCSEWLPLALLALQWTVEERRARGPVVLAASMTALAYSSANMLVVAAIALAVLLPFLLARRAEGAWQRIGLAAAAALVCVLPMAPGILEGLSWRESWSGTADAQRVTMSLDLASLVWPNANDFLLGAILPGRPVGFLEQHFSFFVGLPVGVLAIVALARGAPLAGRAGWLVLGAVGLVLALGPEAKWLERPLGVPLPWAFLEPWLFPLQISRVPARFVVLVSLPLALLAGAGWDALVARWDPASPSTRLLGVLVAAFMAISGAGRWPLAVLDGVEPDAAAIAHALDTAPAGAAVLDLPYDEHIVRRIAMYHQTAHARPIFFAAYPRVPRTNRDHFAGSALFGALTRGGFGPPGAIEGRLAGIDLGAEREALGRAGIGAVVLHHDLYLRVGGADDPVRALVAAEGRAIERALARAWGPGERVSAGFYEAVVFRLDEAASPPPTAN